jgi:hypothetical protein
LTINVYFAKLNRRLISRRVLFPGDIMTRHSCTAFVFLFVATANLSPLIARASSLPTAFGSVEAGTESPAASYSGSPALVASFAPDCAFCGQSQSIVTAGLPSVGAGAFGYAQASAQETYYFEVQAPTLISNISIPAIASGMVFASLQNPTNYILNGDIIGDGASAGATISGAGSLLASEGVSCSDPRFGSDTSNCGSHYLFKDAISLLPNTLYKVSLSAAVTTNDAGEAIGTLGQALADPSIQIDPLFLAANPGFSLEFSDGIDNSQLSPTPLPPSFSMFGAALLGLGVLAWRRQKQAA